jgi:hypothetical protein
MHAARLSRLNRAQRKQKDPNAIHCVDVTAVSVPKKEAVSQSAHIHGPGSERIKPEAGANARVIVEDVFFGVDGCDFSPVTSRLGNKKSPAAGAGRVIKSSAGGGNPRYKQYARSPGSLISSVGHIQKRLKSS